jgi:hypothetical protein
MKRGFFLTSFVEMTLTAVFFLSQSVFAQTPVTVTARAVPSKATIGDEIRLLVQVERPRAYSVAVPAGEQRLDPFEVKRVEATPFVDGKNRVRETFVVVLTVFELGELEIPPVMVKYKDGSGREGYLLGPPAAVKVVSVGKKAADKDDIRPIKGPVSLSMAALRVWALSLLAFFLSVVLAVKVYWRIRNRREIDLESRKPPHERAALELGRLWKRNYLENGKAKEFYSELADILRRYLERQFTIEALEQTSFEIVRSLKEKEFAGEAVSRASELLEQSDLVKFAAFVPSRRRADELAARLSEFVDLTKPSESKQKA